MSGATKIAGHFSNGDPGSLPTNVNPILRPLSDVLLVPSEDHHPVRPMVKESEDKVSKIVKTLATGCFLPYARARGSDLGGRPCPQRGADTGGLPDGRPGR
ncbi:hypothetical protein GCM10027589_03630 [Actinocorallia lasiicapitis]